MEHIGSYQAKTHLPALLDRVAQGRAFVITRQGKPAARLLPAGAERQGVHNAIGDLQAFGRRHRGRLHGFIGTGRRRENR